MRRPVLGPSHGVVAGHERLLIQPAPGGRRAAGDGRSRRFGHVRRRLGGEMVVHEEKHPDAAQWPDALGVLLSSGVLVSRHGRHGTPSTDHRSLVDCAKGVSGPLALHASTRDEPVDSSDSGLETHQHCSPADATRCQSLLLDPDATIRIDLHKWLFLLVTGRGE